jgi:uncharacterized integral membrane protein
MISERERNRREWVVYKFLALALVMVLLIIPTTAPMSLMPDNLWPLFGLLGSLVCAFLIGMLVGREWND